MGKNRKRKMRPQSPPGFRSPKKPNKKEQDKLEAMETKKKKLRAFIDAYTVVCKKHGLQIDAKLTKGKRGIVSMISITPHYEKEKMIKNKVLFLIVHLMRKPALLLFKKRIFLDDYKRVCIEHKLQLNSVMEITNDGIFPKINLANFQEPKVKNWDDCKKENEKWNKEAESDRNTLTEEAFKEKWPDRPYVMSKMSNTD